MNAPIPRRLLAEFFGFMTAHDNDNATDRPWRSILESAASDFMQRHKISGNPDEATQQYLRLVTADMEKP